MSFRPRTTPPRSSRLRASAALGVLLLALALALVPAALARISRSSHRRHAHLVCVTVGRRPAPRARHAAKGHTSTLCVSSHGVARGRLGAGAVTPPASPNWKHTAPPPSPSPSPPSPRTPAPPPAKEPAVPGPGNLAPETGETASDPIDSRFLTDVPFGKRSFWLQPWRAYLDTWPASRLSEALGINFPEDQNKAESTAQLLQDSGFRLARMAISWAALSYEEPTKFLPSHEASITARLTAMHKHGLRPLIVLDANSGAPTPEIHPSLETLAEAPAGATTVQLSPASAAQVVPGKTGFNNLTWSGSPDVLITKVATGGVASLSAPLRNALPAGPHGATTLRFAPFTAPTLAGGEPNPAFQATMNGWLEYVAAVNKIASNVVGPGGYDLEVWNELTFGSQFLNAEHYYAQPSEIPTEASPTEPEVNLAPALLGTEAEEDKAAEAETETQADQTAENEAEGSQEAELENTHGSIASAATASSTPAAATIATAAAKPKISLVSKAIRKAILNETVAFERNPVNGFSPAVGITNGFASETPFPSGASAPLGLTALSKHPYVGAKQFPEDLHKGAIRSVNALGGRDTSSDGSFTPLFVPTYQSDFPEYTLNVVSTETSIRDLAPFTTYVYGFPHGREVGPPGGAPVQKWITEYNLASSAGHTVGPDEVTPQTQPAATLTSADKEHFEAKVVLRSLIANVSKGFTREYFYKAAPGPLSLIGERFWKAYEEHPESYPGDALGGPTMDALRATFTQFQGPGPEGAARQLELLKITQEGTHAQFQGDGSAYHPSLYDRNALAVFPFQDSPTRFSIPVYVMTRDLHTLYNTAAPASDVTRFDLPPENFRITLSNLPVTASPPAVAAYDPIQRTATPATLVSREGASATFEIAATDYPRILTLDYTGK